MTNPTFNLSDLNGSNGFAINGIAAYDVSGFSVSNAGDVNGDGISDVIIGAQLADPNGSDSGQSYVVFGSKNGFSSSLNLSTLNGSNGFTINGIAAGDRSGYSVSSAGDVNGDGIGDVIIGASRADRNGSDSGQSYVVFGSKNGFSSSLNLSTLNGSNGFTINGIAALDNSGYSVSNAGDVNGDGIGDVIIGARGADPNGLSYSGQSYVVFGSNSGFSANLNLSTLNGSNGFALNGIAAFDISGNSVSSAGDVNGDGIGDLIIGARFADANGIYDAGQSYVVFGSKSGFSASLNLSTLNGSNGFTINGIAARDYSGRSVSSAGDVNGDGIDDLIIGANAADSNGFLSGQSYVVFGSKSGFGASLNLSTLNGSNGFAINGAANDYSGFSVSSAGDINGDGIGDLIIGAYGASPNGNIGAGRSYVVFGSKSGFSASLNLSTLNGSNGFALNGIGWVNNSGRSVSSAGDINGDGIDDLIIGAFLADPNGGNSGQSYVVFGTNQPPAVTNQPPVAVNDAISTNEDILLNGNVLAANPTTPDSDPNNDALTVTQINGNTANVGTSVTLTSGALLNVSASGNFTYNPNGKFESLATGTTATDSFTYTISDGKGGTSSATATVTINGVNDAPVAKNDSTTTTQNTPINLPVATLLANDTDVDSGSTLSITAVSAGVGGTVTLNNNGTTTISSDDFIVFSPNNNFTGNANFGYTLSDGSLTSIGTVTVDVTASNLPPVAVNDAISTNEDTLLNGNVLAANPTTPDSDPNNDALTVTQINGNTANVGTSVTLTSGALLNVSASGNFTYNPNGKFESLATGTTATDSFTYTISDGKGGTSSATATVTINGVNDAAIISGTTTAAVTEDTSSPNLTASGNLSIIDLDTGESKFNTNVTKASGNLGSLTIAEAGAFNYSVANSAVQFLAAGQTQTDTFTVKSFDGSTSQNITVTLNGVNDAPVAKNDSTSTTQNTPINIPVANLLANDTDVDSGSILSITAVSAGVGGTVTLNNNGTTTISSDDFIVFSPNNNFTGNASFGYTLSDGSVASTATVTVAVNAVTGQYLTGTNGNDLLTGGDGNDEIEALGGTDTVFGNGGSDYLEGNDGNDYLDGGSGNDEIGAGFGNDTVIGGDGNEWLEGEGGNDLLYGDGLMGKGTGNDTINGGAGIDTLIGGAGSDLLTGGSAKDIFVLGAGLGKDTVNDFVKGTDLIGLSGGLTFSQLTFSGNSILFGSETLAVLNGVNTTTLTAANFVVVSV